MNEFQAYFTLGYRHIADINAYDHMLFLAVLCAVYSIKDWRKIIVMVTAFTVGHSITLAAAVMDIFTLPSDIVEILIPVTIVATGISNLFPTRDHSNRRVYFLTLLFGFIHGMGFSNFLKASLMEGMDESIFTPLLAFNLGVEAGQLLIVAIILAVAWLVLDLLKLSEKYWRIGISVAGIVLALQLIYQLVFV
ncbi:MAG: HupE/UreJ family protein [Saprospiraceae bacterium]|nr:HupE/UreJ family protein [Saprospiraceae bacterium]